MHCLKGRGRTSQQFAINLEKVVSVGSARGCIARRNGSYPLTDDYDHDGTFDLLQSIFSWTLIDRST